MKMATDKQKDLLRKLTLSTAFTQAEADAAMETLEECTTGTAKRIIDRAFKRLKEFETIKRDALARKAAWRAEKEAEHGG